MAKIALMALSTSTLEEKYDCECVLPAAYHSICACTLATDILQM